jgi:hypothetical protein
MQRALSMPKIFSYGSNCITTGRGRIKAVLVIRERGGENYVRGRDKGKRIEISARSGMKG